MAPGSSASPPLERGVVVGAYVLVQVERVSDEEQVWLARTASLPPSPVTARLRGRPGAGAPSPFGQETQLGRFLQHPNLDVATEEHALGEWTCAISTGAPGVPLPDLYGALAGLRAQNEAQWAALVAHIVTSLLVGLDFAHRVTTAPGHPKGVVHGGVRPQAVAVGADGSVRLGGFGVLRDDDPSRVAERGMEAIAYAAPEQFGTRGRAPTMDLWSAGAVLHELLDGRAFRGEHTDVRALYRIALAGEVAPLARAAPEGLERMRAWLLAALPRDRPRAGADAVAAMGTLAAGVAAMLGELVRAHRAGGAPAHASVVHSVAPPAPAIPAFTPPAAMPPPQPPFAPAFASPPRAPAAFVEEEGTVELDQAVLAAMRAGTRPPSAQPPSAQPQPMTPARDAGELMMPPPAARSSRSVAPQRPVAPAQPPAPLHAPHYPAPVQPAAPPRAMPAAAAPRSPSPPPRDHGPLELHPSYEPTTMTMLQARKSTRNFVLIIVIGAILAIVVGVGVGYLIVSDDAATPSKAAPKPNPP